MQATETEMKAIRIGRLLTVISVQKMPRFITRKRCYMRVVTRG